MPDPATIPDQGILSDLGGPNGLMTLLNGLFGTSGGGTSDSTSPEALDAATTLFQGLLPSITGTDFSPEAATRDAQGQVDQIIRNMTESTSAGVPAITSAENMNGGYGGTTTGLLKNDLASRIASAGASQVATVKSNYASARTQQLAAVVGLINAMANAHKSTASTNKTNGQVNNSTAQKAAAALAAAAALKKAMSGSAPPGGAKQSAKDTGPTKDPAAATNPDNASQVSDAIDKANAESPYGSGELTSEELQNIVNENNPLNNPDNAAQVSAQLDNPENQSGGTSTDISSNDFTNSIDGGTIADFTSDGNSTDISGLGDVSGLLDEMGLTGDTNSQSDTSGDTTGSDNPGDNSGDTSGDNSGDNFDDFTFDSFSGPDFFTGEGEGP